MSENYDPQLDGADDQPREGFFRRNRKKLTVGGIGGGLVATAGVAVAAILLSTSIGAEVGLAKTEKDVSDEITKIEVRHPSDMKNCDATLINGERFELDATADKTVLVGEDGSKQVVDDADGSCFYKVYLENTGDVTLALLGISVNNPAPHWHLRLVTPPDTIDAGDTAALTLELTSDFKTSTGEYSIEATLDTEPVTP